MVLFEFGVDAFEPIVEVDEGIDDDDVAESLGEGIELVPIAEVEALEGAADMLVSVPEDVDVVVVDGVVVTVVEPGVALAPELL